MKWKMISHSEFQMDESGYHVDLNVHGSFCPVWTIVKDGVIIDNAMRHSPVTSDCNKELAAKAQVERILTKLISENSKTLELVNVINGGLKTGEVGASLTTGTTCEADNK